MTINATLHTKVEISADEEKDIATTYLRRLYGSRPVVAGRDELYVDVEGNLILYEDWGSRGDDRRFVRKATDLDKAIYLILKTIK
jgi:hypothetical protein